MWSEGLTPEMVARAKEELGETQEVKEQCLKDLRRLIHDEPDFSPLMDDAFLVRFLRARKYDVKKTFKTLRNYYTFKARYSGILTDLTPDDLLSIVEMNNVFVLPKRHPSGAAVGVMRLGCYDLDKVTPEEIYATSMLAMEVIIESEVTQVCGYILIFDLSNVGLKAVRHFLTPTFLYRTAKLLQDCIPYRIKAFHTVYEPFFIGAVHSLMKPLMSEKLNSRVHFHGSNLKKFHQLVPSSILPTELGGTLGTAASCAKESCSRVLGRRDLFEKLKKYGYQGKAAEYIRRRNSKTLFN